MQSIEVREKFLKFFESKGHKRLPSSPLIPEGDISVLFTTAGMQQFKPYYGAPDNAIKDFGTKNIVTVQKCVRTGDIDEVGDDTHLSFFEMLGNFSFGGYGRKEAIEYAHEFITKELGLPISYVTIYKGEGVVPKDEESREIWKSIDSNLDIREDGADVFWGPTGDSGPCGPTTEIYCKNANGDDVEVWNIVFNEYFCDGSREKLDKGEASLKKLDTLGIDTGMGFERLLATVQNKKSVYDTDLFEKIMYLFNNNENLKIKDEKSFRIIADHLRTSCFMIADGVKPSNEGRGYVLRRIIRKMVRVVNHNLKIDSTTFLRSLSSDASMFYSTQVYPELYNPEIAFVIGEEEKLFKTTLEKGEKEFKKIILGSIGMITGNQAATLFTSFGFPIELTVELAKEEGKVVDLDEYYKEIKKHKELSKTASAGMFKGGLANHNEKTIKLHTAHHLLLAALQQIIHPTDVLFKVKQRGSNINEERLRIDFVCERKLTDEEKQKVEDWVNEKIEQGLDVVQKDMPLAEAEKIGAEMEFGAKYPETVSVYFIEDKDGNPISKEFCGGPHVSNTSELGHFKIQKEEAVAAGIRRIKAILD